MIIAITFDIKKYFDCLFAFALVKFTYIPINELTALNILNIFFFLKSIKGNTIHFLTSTVKAL